MQTKLQTKTIFLFLYSIAVCLSLSVILTPSMASASTCTQTVTTTADSGTGSLREAIFVANVRNPGLDTICFDIPGTGTLTIRATDKFAVIDPIIIDGTTQSGYAGVPRIRIDGASAGNVPGIWITEQASGSTIKGIAITRFRNNGIKLEGSGNKVLANYIGINTDGKTAGGNGYDVACGDGCGGVGITGDRNLIGNGTLSGRNIISGNKGNGVDIVKDPNITATGTGNIVKGNFIGTSKSGMSAVPNSADGVLVTFAAGNTIGGSVGTTPGGMCTGDCNLLSGNGYNGVGVWNIHGTPITSKNNKVLGNFVGVNRLGTGAIPNYNIGIELYESPDNLVGGTTAAARNVSSGNGGAGVFITGTASTGNVVIGNFIGTDTTGMADIGNIKMGVGIGYSPGIDPAHHNIIGGTSRNTPGAACTGSCNLISGNGQNGVLIIGSSPGSNKLLGNYIGTNVSGRGYLGNDEDGIGILESPNNRIGDGTAAGGNVISGNKKNGITIAGSISSGTKINGNYIGVGIGATLGNGGNGIMVGAANNTAITGNGIYGNGKFGIDLGQNNVDINDLGDGDGGVNSTQNYPSVFSAKTVAGNTKIGGTFNSTPQTSFRIDFFSSAGCYAGKPNNYGQGQLYIGNTTVTTDIFGNTTFSFSPLTAVAGGRYITSTATRLNGSIATESSEFSKCALVNSAKPALTDGATWYLKDDLTTGTADHSFGYGFPASFLLCAWDPNQPGVKLPVIFSGGTWYMRASYTTGAADLTVSFGGSTAKPICGDWDGDGVDTVGTYDNGDTWSLKNVNSSGAADKVFRFGAFGATPVAGDWDGDGVDTVGVVNSASGWSLRNSNSAGAASASFSYGSPGSNPVIGDWDGDGTDTIGVVSAGGTWSLRNSNSAGAAQVTFQFGGAGLRPLIW